MILMLKLVRGFDFRDTGAMMFTLVARVISKANMALRPVGMRMEDGTCMFTLLNTGGGFGLTGLRRRLKVLSEGGT